MKEYLKTFILIIIFLGCVEANYSQCTGKWLGDICKLYRVNENAVTGTSLGGSKFRIEKVYKGNLKGIIEIDLKLKKGKKFLIFPRPILKSSGKFTLYCSALKRLEKSKYEIKFLEALKTQKTKNRIYGFILYEFERDRGFSTRISFVGKDKTFETTSDKNGFYEIYGLPKGIYQMKAELPKNKDFVLSNSSDKEEKTFEVYGDSDSCRAINLMIRPNNLLGGKVYASNGDLVKYTETLNLGVEPRGTNQQFYIHKLLKNKSNTFEISGLPGGEYKLVINPRPYFIKEWGEEEDFPKLYYPGTTDPEKAHIFSVDDLTKYQNLEFRLPAGYPLKLVSGKVYFSDGKIATNVYVRFFEKEKELQAYDITDLDGFFQLFLKKGSFGKLESTFVLKSRDKTKCNIDLNQGFYIKNFSEYRFNSNPLNLQIDFDLINQKVTFPIEKCGELAN